jgi:hypothetical protein
MVPTGYLISSPLSFLHGVQYVCCRMRSHQISSLTPSVFSLHVRWHLARIEVPRGDSTGRHPQCVPRGHLVLLNAAQGANYGGLE